MDVLPGACQQQRHTICTAQEYRSLSSVSFFVQPTKVILKQIPKHLPLLVTAGLPISCTLGHGHNLFCRGPNLKPRPVLDLTAQTIPGKVLDFFCKTSKRACCASFREKVFSKVFSGTKSALWAQIDFLVSRKYTTSVNLVLEYFFRRKSGTY